MQLQFKDITIDDKQTIEKYTLCWNIESADFSFANMFMWCSDSKYQYAEKDDYLYLTGDFPGEKFYMWPPVPLNEEALKNYRCAVKTAEKYMTDTNKPISFRSLCSPFNEWFEEYVPEYTISPCRDGFDYVYLSEKMINLKGKKLHSKRNFINRIKLTHPDFQYEDLTKDNLEECMALYDEWNIRHDEETIERFHERETIVRAIENMDKLGLTGGIIRIDGKMKAFTVGERKLPTMTQIHIEKAANDIDGLYQLINQQYAQRHCTETTYINREEDMGIEGMRKAKLSYYPDRMIEKYNAFLQTPCESCIIMCNKDEKAACRK